MKKIASLLAVGAFAATLSLTPNVPVVGAVAAEATSYGHCSPWAAADFDGYASDSGSYVTLHAWPRKNWYPKIIPYITVGGRTFKVTETPTRYYAPGVVRGSRVYVKWDRDLAVDQSCSMLLA